MLGLGCIVPETFYDSPTQGETLSRYFDGRLLWYQSGVTCANTAVNSLLECVGKVWYGMGLLRETRPCLSLELPLQNQH